MSDLSSSPGLWHSPISAEILFGSSIKLNHLHVDQTKLYYSETRLAEKGRTTLLSGSTNGEVVPDKFNVKTRVNEYGGKCFTVRNNLLVFFDLFTQSLYLKDLCVDTLSLLYHRSGWHFADLILDPSNTYMYAIAEDKNLSSSPAFLIRMHLQQKELEILHSEEDFYAQPRISPCGHKLAFISWNHPYMPWDQNILWLADIEKEGLKNLQKISCDYNVSCDQLIFSFDSSLFFTCDKQGYSQLYFFKTHVEQLTFDPINFGVNHWIYGSCRLAFKDHHQLILIGTEKAQDSLYLFTLSNKNLKKIPTPFTFITELAFCDAALVCIAASVTAPLGLYRLLADDSLELIKVQESFSLDKKYIPLAKELTIPSKEDIIYGFYYPPCNPSYSKALNPPVIIKVHSGPTAHVTPRFHSDIVFFTSRGFAYFEVNYRGSSGYSKHFQQSLNGYWGDKDVEDIKTAALYLVKQHLAHPQLLFLKGSSAGGFTLFCLLHQMHIFTGAVSYYGVYDLIDLSKHTHKFEKHYLDTLIAANRKTQNAIYKNKSPINHLDSISTPVLLFHGDKDPVVSIHQTNKVYKALKAKDCCVELITFSQEGHGFKEAITLKTCLEKELSFYHKLITQHLSVYD
jgi:dipeptidyl aminopeptidase/acylaminoacyl peptidase